MTTITQREHLVDSRDVMALARRSSCSAYDSEFVAPAQTLDAPLITEDEKIAESFPDIVLSMSAFSGGGR